MMIRNASEFKGMKELPRMMFTCLRGGKVNNSKVKVFLNIYTTI